MTVPVNFGGGKSPTLENTDMYISNLNMLVKYEKIIGSNKWKIFDH